MTQPEPAQSFYDHKKERALKKLAEVFEEILKEFPCEGNDQIREDIANYTIGYMGVSFGLHVKR